MKRFSVAQDREFEVAGEVFTWIYPYWEDIAEVFDRDTAEENADVDFSVKATIADFIERIQLFIDPDQRERWVQLTKRRKNPIPHSQYSQLYQWLLEVTSATPIELSQPSEDGQQQIVAT